MNIIQKCLAILGIDNGTMEQAPLTAQKAYEMFAAEGRSKAPDMQAIYDTFLQSQYKLIADRASKFRYTYAVISYPDWFTEAQQVQLANDLTSQGYNVGYQDENLLFVLWTPIKKK